MDPDEGFTEEAAGMLPVDNGADANAVAVAFNRGRIDRIIDAIRHPDEGNEKASELPINEKKWELPTKQISSVAVAVDQIPLKIYFGLKR